METKLQDSIFEPFTLPNGGKLKNRLAKAAMEENMAERQQQPGSELLRLYQAWARGGVGLIITGNVMVDRLAMTGPGGLALDNDSALDTFKTWAAAGKLNGTRLWMQINHPGRQVYKNMGGKALAPSAIALDLGKHSGMFAQPKAMSEEEIQDVIERFVLTASLAQQAGFDGVEVHAAHGYLLAQFLSPLTNKRSDQWGGSLENRARLLLVIIKAIKEACGPQFDLAVKLNSADFQRGGFDIEDAESVAQMLSELNVDMLELSGGSYEAPAMQGRTADDRTLAREAYFLEFAARVAKKVDIPVMTTGGVRRLPVAKTVIENGIDLVGMGTALAFCPDLPNRWQSEPSLVAHVPSIQWKDKALVGLANMAVVKRQLRRVGEGKKPKLNISAGVSLLLDQLRKSVLTKRYRKERAL
jgi:2,4-dienoyl-CoA reductase-like NADH-dependent reductase (Old Yellow Enzyme family)